MYKSLPFLYRCAQGCINILKHIRQNLQTCLSDLKNHWIESSLMGHLIKSPEQI